MARTVGGTNDIPSKVLLMATTSTANTWSNTIIVTPGVYCAGTFFRRIFEKLSTWSMGVKDLVFRR